MAVDLSALQRHLPGRVHLPRSEEYERLATPWNRATVTAPAAVVAIRDGSDVAAAVRFAGEAGMPVVVQCTGHGVATDMVGALLVHTAALDECTVHPEGWARVGAGVRWQTVLDAAAPHGLAPLAGSAPHVGVVGYTTGGGIGPLARTWGAASDRVRALDVVTGDGVQRRVTPETEPDLFWGLRGGKGSLGVVTAVEFDLEHQPELYAGAVYFDGADAATVLHAWRRWCGDLPREATTSVAMLNLPAGVPGVPPPLAGRASVAVRFAWTGSPERGAQLLAPVRGAAEPLLDGVGVLPYAGLGAIHADPVDPVPAHEGNVLLDELPEEAVDALLAVAGPGSGSPQLLTEVRQLGGALAQESAPSARCHRDAAFGVQTIGLMVPPLASVVVAHTAVVTQAVAPWSSGGVLANFGAAAGAAGFPRCFDDATYARLTALADRYDPHRVLRLGQVPGRRADGPQGAASETRSTGSRVR